MHKMTHIETLGVDYAVGNQDGKFIRMMQVIPHTEILEAAVGEYTESYGSMSDYIRDSISVLAGNEDIDPYSVYWHATYDQEVVLSEVIEYAIKNGYTSIILEHLEIVE